MDLMLPGGRLYHHAYVVPDLEAAMDRLGEIFNMEWAPIALRHHHVIADGYEVNDVDFRLTYSTTGPPHIELVEGVAGSIWPRPDEITFHHVGLWASDLRADSQRYVDLGLPIVAHGTD